MTLSLFSLILPVANLERSTSFYSALGYPISQRCSSDRAVCVAISEQVELILQSRRQFATLTAREVVDADRGVEAIFALELSGRSEVDELVDRAIAAGGRPAGAGVERGQGYCRGFLDPDAHQFAVLVSNRAKVEMSSRGRAGLSSSTFNSRRTE